MKYYLKKRESLPEGIDRITRILLDSSYKLLTDNEENPDIAIHEVRKNIKKLRALLRLLSPGMTRKAFRKNNRRLRDFARQLGGARDSATLLASLNHIKQHYSPFLDESATAPVCEELVRRHERAMRAYQASIEISNMEDQLQHIATQLGKLDRFEFTLGTLFSSLEQHYRQGRRGLKTLRNAPTTLHGHEFRKEVKTLWYQLRLLRKWNPGELAPMIRQLGEIGEMLGQDHDLAVLVDTLPSIQSTRDAPVRSELLNSLAESRRIALLSHSVRMAEQLYARKTGKFMAWFKSIQQEQDNTD